MCRFDILKFLLKKKLGKTGHQVGLPWNNLASLLIRSGVTLFQFIIYNTYILGAAIFTTSRNTAALSLAKNVSKWVCFFCPFHSYKSKLLKAQRMCFS